MMEELVAFMHDEEAVTEVGHALLLALVTVASIGAWHTLGDNIRCTVEKAARELANAADGVGSG